MRRLLKFSSERFTRRTNDYTYPELKTYRPRVTRRERSEIREERDRSGSSRSECVDARR
jgi:hypothetical protein